MYEQIYSVCFRQYSLLPKSSDFMALYKCDYYYHFFKICTPVVKIPGVENKVKNSLEWLRVCVLLEKYKLLDRIIQKLSKRGS